MVAITTVAAAVAAATTTAAVIWRGGRWFERSRKRQGELSSLDGRVERISENMATREDIERLHAEVDVVKDTMVELHDEHQAIRMLYGRSDERWGSNGEQD
jgi:hypothetical protein